MRLPLVARRGVRDRLLFLNPLGRRENPTCAALEK